MQQVLPTIKRPADLKRLKRREMRKLTGEIREFLIRNVSKTGGHLGPNLGVIELTLAIHRVFSSPADTIIFDTGHQSYVHKLVTGRQNFNHFRSADGLSGYPARAESNHDVVENSHASTALAWAQGIAEQKLLKGDPTYTVAVIGDGAMTGGMAWEALNNIAARPDLKLIIILNDNDRSYAPTIGGFARHLDALRTSPLYDHTLNWGKRRLLALGKPGELVYSGLHAVKQGVKDFLLQQELFSGLGIKYTGPIDGHDIPALEFALRRAMEYGRPVIVHAITRKGNGYSPAETNEVDRFHTIAPIHPETGLPIVRSRFGFTNVFADEIVKLAEQQENIVGISAAMMEPVGLSALQQKYPHRVFDVGIAEQHAVTFAAGLAYAGAHPVVALYATFLNRGWDQLLFDVALHHEGVTVVLDRAGITGADGASHNGVWDLAICGLIPELSLAAPRDESTLRARLREAVKIEDRPTVIRYSKGSLPADFPVVASTADYDVLSQTSDFDLLADVDIAAGSRPVPGEPATKEALADAKSRSRRVRVIALGVFAQLGLDLAEQLRQAGVEVQCISPKWALPVPQALVSEAREFDLVVTLEDGIKSNGYGAFVRSALMEKGVLTSVQVEGITQKFITTDSRENILLASGLEASQIAQRTLKILSELDV